jgi:hypothetical protein
MTIDRMPPAVRSRRCLDGLDTRSLLRSYGLHQIFTLLASARISDGLGDVVVESTAVITIALHLGWLYVSQRRPFPRATNIAQVDNATWRTHA